jgi:hypothetical protein
VHVLSAEELRRGRSDALQGSSDRSTPRDWFVKRRENMTETTTATTIESTTTTTSEEHRTSIVDPAFDAATKVAVDALQIGRTALEKSSVALAKSAFRLGTLATTLAEKKSA